MNAFDFGYLGLAAITAPIWMRKARGGWDQRLARVVDCPPAGDRPRVLLHAVSVGEANAIRSLVPILAETCDVVVSTTTDTGLARAQALYGSEHTVVRFPLDFSASVKRFLDVVKPDAVGLVELELWPNFLKCCHQRDIPVSVINGRLSERSFKGYRRARPFIGGMFRGLSACCVQDSSYAARFTEMGASDVRITGSMKWDVIDGQAPESDARQLQEQLGIDPDTPLIVAGSTGPGEEHLLRESIPQGVQLLCAPRKPERFDEAAAALPGCVRRSRRERASQGERLFLLDTLGELRAAYALADLVVVGRSFGDLYGSDPIEPISLARPTLIGPRVDDFREIVNTFEQAGGIVRTDLRRLATDLAELLQNEDRRGELVRCGLGVIEQQRGASLLHAEVLKDKAQQAFSRRSAP